MKEWNVNVWYGSKKVILKSVLEYESSQIMRIRVFGNKTSILLENNYPMLFYGKSKKGIKWQIKEGKLNAATKESSQLLINIFSYLEIEIKEYFDQKEKEKLGFKDD